MGGVAAYQAASALNTALNPVSRWVRRGLTSLHGEGPNKPRVLEVGAVNTQLLDSKELAVRAIDLHSTDPRIEQCDFFSLAHGGEADLTGGGSCPRPYDAIVCSMVLNCVPTGRRRFEMLLGIRALLRSGGRAFVTLPRTCLAHSFTMTEASFVDAMEAVGLRRLSAAPGDNAAGFNRAHGSSGSTNADAPASTKIVYFACEATRPNPEAALRVQKARHGARNVNRFMKERPKSAGAAFDVDVGGCLGFGVRVPRSYEGTEIGRSAREQSLVRGAFLRAQSSGSVVGATEPTESEGKVHREGGGVMLPRSKRGLADLEQADELRDETMESGATSAAVKAQIAQAMASGDDRALDYQQWCWHAGQGGWGMTDSGVRDEGSAQMQSGWQWMPAGWKQSVPLKGYCGGGAQNTGTIEAMAEPPKEHGESVVGAGRPRRPRRQRRKRHLKARLWNAPAVWWRRLL